MLQVIAYVSYAIPFPSSTQDSKVVFFLTYSATGKQGGSVARSLLQNKYFHVRCITRSPTSAKAKELARLGAEICQADGFNEADLLRAFNGGWGAFVNTNSEDRVCSSLVPQLPPLYPVLLLRLISDRNLLVTDAQTKS